MWRRILFGFVVLLLPSSAVASEYCFRIYKEEIAKASGELSAILARQIDIDALIQERFALASQATSEITTIATSDPTLEVPGNRERMLSLAATLETANTERVAFEAEGHSNNERVVELRGAVPAQLQTDMQSCAAEVGPVNAFVNFGVQGFALAATGGLSYLLPEKALYIDMGEIIKGGRVLGGPDAFVVKARDDVLESIGIGGDVEIILKDPKQMLPWNW